MADKKSTFLSMVLTLFLVTFISASILGFVHDMTREAIETAKIKAQNDAITSILPEFAELGKSIKTVPEEGGDSLEIFPAYNESKELIGVAVKTWSKNGFGGLIRLMAGFSPDGTITGYQVLEHKETPGLGSKMSTWFNDPAKPGQNIVGKNPANENLTVRKDGGDVDAITASTISSRAFLEAVRRAYDTYRAASSLMPADQMNSQSEKTEGGAENEPME
ncbi:MAG: RnfABCDGE type electron transport complex subunit G [Prolixibacteraceae bacterium]